MLKILLDTDIGNDMDDMQALAYLLARDDVELLGITTVTGEVETRAMLADMMCRLAKKDVPIHLGCESGLNGEFKQKRVNPYEKALVDSFPHKDSFTADTAVEFLRETIEADPGEIILCVIGPATNIAKLFTKYPHIPSLLKKLVIMGGKYGEADSSFWGEYEWNIINDVPAARIMFDAPVSDALVFGVELTKDVFRTDVNTTADLSASCPMLKPFSVAIRNCPAAWYHDAVALSALFCTDGMAFERGNISVTEQGETVFTKDLSGRHLLMTEFDVEKFFRHFCETVGIPMEFLDVK